jgi:putative CocE/NonD family hydrolase
MIRLVSLCLALVLCVWPVEVRAQAPTSDARFSAAAAQLLDRSADAAPTGRRLRLLLAAGRYAEAEAAAVTLADQLRAQQPGRAAALTPLRIYARARAHEAAGIGKDAALARAFAELYAALPDREMAAVLPYYGANLEQMRERATQAAAACAGVALTECDTGADAVSAWATLEVWSYLIPASEPLIRADAERRFVVDDTLLVPTADGVEIAVLLVRPRTATAERLTTLMSFTIYNRDDWSFADAVQMASRGYAGAVAYSRGKGRSTGDPVPYLHDGADAAAVIDWLAARDWSDGRVGMFSGSYNAFTQWAALKHRPRALRAIATNASNAPGIDFPMQGGVFQNFTYPWPLYAASGSALDETTYGDRDRWARLNRNWFLSGRPYRDLPRIDGRSNPIFASWLDHPDYDAFWQAMIPQGREFADIDIPVYVQTGYFDGGMVGALHYFREHLRHRPDADHRLIVGPYHHTAQQSGVLASINGYDLDRSALIDLTEIRMQWFDHVFRGAPLPEALSDRVNFQVMGADVWRHVPTLEAMAPDRLRLFLGEAAEAGGGHALSPTAPTAGAAIDLTVDLADRSGLDVEVPPGRLDTSAALRFETEPFPNGLEIAGSFLGRLEVVTNKRDVDLEVVLFEHRADGGYFRLSSWMSRASYADDRRSRRLLTPGEPRTLAFESETVTGRRLAPGSRIVALVGVPFRPDVQINYGTGRDVSDESIADAGDPLTVRFLPGGYLELGTRPGP